MNLPHFAATENFLFHELNGTLLRDSICFGEKAQDLIIANRAEVFVVCAHGREVHWRGKIYNLTHAPLQETARAGSSHGHGHHDLPGIMKTNRGDGGFHGVARGETIVNENDNHAGHFGERPIAPEDPFLADHLFVFLRDDLLQIVRFNLKTRDGVFGNKLDAPGCAIAPSAISG